MTRDSLRRTRVVSALLACACGGETGQERVEVPLYLAGSDVSQPVLAANGVALTLTRAELAFGPLYLCAGTQAGDFCDTARMEWLDSTTVDTLDEDERRAGDLVGVSGPVRSWMYDLGISSALTSAEPIVTEAAKDLGGASFLLEGTATSGASELRFIVRIAIAQGPNGERGMPIIRKSLNESFEHEVDRDERGLLLRFDPSRWLQRLDFAPYFTELPCEVEAACSAEVLLEEPGPVYDQLRLELEAGERPNFEWGFVP